MKITLGTIQFEIYIGLTNKLIYSISVKNKFGGSIGYADSSLLKIFLWWLK